MEVTRSHDTALDESVAALRLDRNGQIADATMEAASMLGFGVEEIRGLTLGDLAAERWRDMADGATARILLGDARSFQLLLRGKSGRRTLVQMTSNRVVQDGEASYVLAWSEQFTNPTAESMKADAPELRRLANGLLRTRELERSRVATELHSGVGPLIVISKFMIEDAVRRVTEGGYAEGVDLLNAAIGRLRDVLDEVRRISTELRPSLLDDLGLLPTVEWLCRTFEQTYRTVRVERQISVTEIEVPEPLKLIIFRIIEELLANVAQHANASYVQVVLTREENELCLTVQDDGDGFDATLLGYGVDHVRGIGLPSIRKRMEATGGRLALDSMPHRGVRIGASWALPLGTLLQ
ncbi:MAG: ATP-binding protein [Burkholderiaceae bacterium]